MTATSPASAPAPAPGNPPGSPPPSRRKPLLEGEWAYIAPMGIFLVLVWVGGNFKDYFPLAYALRTFVVAAVLYLCWAAYTKIKWSHEGLGVLFGVLGLIQWVGMEKGLMWLGANVHPLFSYTSLASPADAFNPYAYFAEYPAWMLWTWIAIRWGGASLVVPVMEELFWRDWLWRTMIAPNNYELAEVGEYDHKAFWLIPLLFAVVHVQWATSIVWALMCGWLLWRTKSIGACIIMHATTNFLLGAYVLLWEDWYFW